MGKINILDSNVFNMISAGEVVERPSSVIKELVENSIDAGATRVDVYVEEGGLDKIQVSDNGVGIEKKTCAVRFYRTPRANFAKSQTLTVSRRSVSEAKH